MAKTIKWLRDAIIIVGCLALSGWISYSVFVPFKFQEAAAQASINRVSEVSLTPTQCLNEVRKNDSLGN